MKKFRDVMKKFVVFLGKKIRNHGRGDMLHTKFNLRGTGWNSSEYLRLTWHTSGHKHLNPPCQGVHPSTPSLSGPSSLSSSSSSSFIHHPSSLSGLSSISSSSFIHHPSSLSGPPPPYQG
eukprot:1153026-Pelagomonas_calceolata.AAC.2